MADLQSERSYAFLLRADGLGALGMLVSGPEGAAKQLETIRALGGTCDKQLAVAGRYDIILIATFPTPEAAFAFGQLQTSAGFYCETLLGFEPSKVEQAARLAEPAVRKNMEEDTAKEDAT